MKIIYAGRECDLSREVGRRLASAGVEMAEAFDEASASALVAANGAKLLLLDLELPGGCALALIERTRRARPGMSILALVEEDRLEKQARAFALGAAEVVVLPVDVEALAGRAKALMERAFVVVETHGHPSLWSESTQEVYRRIERAATSKATVLITGETGTGKEVAARTLHELSARRGKPFVAVNCAALSSGLLESELFGHEKGAFTDASFARKGRFEEAEGGTLLLDEVSEMDSRLQAKLLRVLQEGTFERVGSNRALRPDVRVIATSNRHLKEEVIQGRFRQDLYYRLNVLCVHMPALRDRKEDVSLFLNFFCDLRGIRVSAAARARLLAFSWPGNIREIENLIERFAVMGEGGVLGLQELPDEVLSQEVGNSTAPEALSQTLAETIAMVERRAIEEALRKCDGSQTEAARILGIPRSTLRDKLKAFGMANLLELAGEPE